MDLETQHNKLHIWLTVVNIFSFQGEHKRDNYWKKVPDSLGNSDLGHGSAVKIFVLFTPVVFTSLLYSPPYHAVATTFLALRPLFSCAGTDVTMVDPALPCCTVLLLLLVGKAKFDGIMLLCCLEISILVICKTMTQIGTEIVVLGQRGKCSHLHPLNGAHDVALHMENNVVLPTCSLKSKITEKIAVTEVN